MAQRHESALRQHRRSLRARACNQQNTAQLRTGLRKIREAIAAKRKDDVNGLLRETIALIDRSASKRTIHRNAAARLKSRLVRSAAASTK